MVAHAFSRAERDGKTDRIWCRAALKLHVGAATLLRRALQLSHEPTSLARLAAAARMHERTLRKYCESQLMPSPQWIIGWARCLPSPMISKKTGAAYRVSALSSHSRAPPCLQITFGGIRE